MTAFSNSIKAAVTLEPELWELAQVRASMTNGCGYCVDMHSLNLTSLGETPARIASLACWTDSSLFTDRERAALALTDKVTDPHQEISDEFLLEVHQHFSRAEVNQLILLVTVINGWNRLMKADHAKAGNYTPPK